MADESTDWEQRVAAVWARADELGDEGVIESIDGLAAERPADDALALAERGGARDSAGLEAEAEPFYRAALAVGLPDHGLPDDQRAQVTIQLASTIRNLGRADESLELLRAEFADRPDSPLAAAGTAFAALALASLGREREALVAALHALAPTLPRYQRAVHAYADELLVGPQR